MAEDTSIARRMLFFINQWPKKPVRHIGLDAMPKEGPGMMLRQLAGEHIERRYVDGSMICLWPFGVMMRIQGEETGQRLDAAATLEALSLWMRTQRTIDLGPGRRFLGISMRSCPAQSAAYQGGAEDYMAVFLMRYKTKEGQENG